MFLKTVHCAIRKSELLFKFFKEIKLLSDSNLHLEIDLLFLPNFVFEVVHFWNRTHLETGMILLKSLLGLH